MLKVIVKYEQGKKNVIADALSRLKAKDKNSSNITVATLNYVNGNRNIKINSKFSDLNKNSRFSDLNKNSNFSNSNFYNSKFSNSSKNSKFSNSNGNLNFSDSSKNSKFSNSNNKNSNFSNSNFSDLNKNLKFSNLNKISNFSDLNKNSKFSDLTEYSNSSNLNKNSSPDKLNIFNINNCIDISPKQNPVFNSIPSENYFLNYSDDCITSDSEIILSTNNSDTNDTSENIEYPGSNRIREFLKRKIITIDRVKYFQDKECIRKIIENKEEKIELLLAAHSVGHEGFFKTYNRLKRKYYWKNMSKDVELLVKTCHDCQINRLQPVNSGTESFATKPGLPFSRVGLDIIGPLPITRNNNSYIIVLVDYFSKWVEAEPLCTIESADVIKFLTNIFSRHGTPEILVTDNGLQFTSCY